MSRLRFDVYTGQNHCGYLRNYKVIVPVKVDDFDVVNYSYAVKYDCRMYYDPKKNENINSIKTVLRKNILLITYLVLLLPR